MSFMAITGVPGTGKTLSMVFLMMRQYAIKGRHLYANFHLHDDAIIRFLTVNYGIEEFDYTYIENAAAMENIKNGVFGGDEIWSWMDSRTSGKVGNRTKATQLIKFRKRVVDMYYSCQLIHTMDKRIRQITEFEAEPILVKQGKICVLNMYILNTENQKREKKIDTFKFYTAPFYDMYDTEEEIVPEF